MQVEEIAKELHVSTKTVYYWVPVIASHGLRHSTSELYIHHGATRDDLRRLFAHSTPAVTDRYVHNRGTNLERVANVIQLFPVASGTK
jgi:integrase